MATTEQLYSMKCGEILGRGSESLNGFQWMITRVPSGWIYTCDKGQWHSVFVPFDNCFDGSF